VFDCYFKVKETIKTDKAPEAIGPYSQAIKYQGFVFVSGQIPLEPATGELLQGGVAQQTRLVLENICEILKEARVALTDVVKTTVYLKDMTSFQEMNAVYEEFFQIDPPARATVEVSNLPKGADIEIELIAVCGV
jgi:2-iminobutanoate/2-iminopropanoate deaminase